jgi:hypothetical protein
MIIEIVWSSLYLPDSEFMTLRGNVCVICPENKKGFLVRLVRR